MKRKGIIAIIYLLMVAILAFIVFALFDTEEDTESKEEVKIEVVEEEPVIEQPEDVAGKFFAVIYGYDTSDRMFYEGADKFMTEEAYEQLLPMPSKEPMEDSYFHMVSELDHYLIYSREISDKEVELLAEVYFSVSGSGEYKQRQIVKLHMEQKNEQWIITECSVMDTEGE